MVWLDKSIGPYTITVNGSSGWAMLSIEGLTFNGMKIEIEHFYRVDKFAISEYNLMTITADVDNYLCNRPDLYAKFSKVK